MQTVSDYHLRRTFLSFLFLFLILFFANPLFAQENDSQDRIPYTMFHDFETGELFSWEPYPYQQDIGYDALYFTQQSPTYQNSQHALARPVTANHTTDLYQGFTRQLNLWTTSETRLQAAVYFQSDRNLESLEITLGTFGGQRYKHTIEHPKANEWLEIDLPIDRFQLDDGEKLRPDKHIQVVTLKGSYPEVYYLYTYTVLMDNVQINGERQRRFVATSPESTVFEEFDKSILHRHYTAGEVISLQVQPEGDIDLESVQGTLTDGHGNEVRSDIPFSKTGEVWGNKSIYTVAQSDNGGRWRLDLTGERPNGSTVEWSLEFLVPVEPLVGHPRLFFTEEELSERLNADQSSAEQRILENIRADRDFMEVDLDDVHEGVDIPAEAFTFGPYGKDSVLRNQWRPPLYTLRDVIRDGSFHYAFFEDREAGERAREALIKLCHFSQWNTGWMIENQFWTYYPLGYVLQAVAIGYDLLQDLLTEEEKQLVREAMMERALKPFYRDMVEMNRMPSHGTNHLSVLVSGYGMAATVLYGEDPENPWMEPYLSGILEKLEAFVSQTYFEDGSYREPMGYHGHATNNIVQAFDVFERNYDLPYSTSTHVKHFYKMPLLGSSAEGKVQDFGDYNVGNDFSMTAPRSQWFVKRLGDPLLYNYVKPFWESGKGGVLGYLWYRDDIEPQPRETLPTSKIFFERGAIMRSGWDDEAAIIHLRTGPNANHYHYDQGSIQIQANDEELLTDPGVGYGGYYGNLNFSYYNMQAVGHNVMLVDGDPQSQAPAHYNNGVASLTEWPRLIHTFTGELADATVSDLATVYKEKLEHYTRTLLYTKDGPLFLFDRVRSVSNDGHTYNWLFHAPMNSRFDRSVSWDNHRMTVERPNARLTMDVVAPEIVSTDITDNDEFRHPETLLRLDSEPGLTDAAFLAVLWPEARSTNSRAGEFDAPPVAERIEADGWLGARVSREGRTDYGLFRTNIPRHEGTSEGESNFREADVTTVAGFATDAHRFTATLDASDNLVRYYLEGSSFEGHGRSLSSDLPVTAAVLHHDEGTDVEADVPGSTRLSLSVDREPSRVTLGGSPVQCRYNNGQLTLQLPEGRQNIEIRL